MIIIIIIKTALKVKVQSQMLPKSNHQIAT